MNEDRYVAAIEISSSKIIGAIGRLFDDGRLEVVAVDQEKCIECVRRGFIQNIDETTIRVGNIVEKLQKRPAMAQRKITKVFIGLSGRSMCAIPTSTSLNLPDETIIDQAIIDRLHTQVLASPIEGSLEAIDAVERSFQVNGRSASLPKGMLGTKITGEYSIIAARPELKKNIRRVVTDKMHIEVGGFIVTPLATAHLILTEDQKRLGTVLVDMGAETTTVAIFKAGALVYLATIPIGSRNITLDLTTLSILEERAEEIKTTSGNALAPETPLTLNIDGLKYADVSNIVVARAEEIVTNIIAQIQYSGLKKEDLPGGIVLIGGGSKLNGMVELLKRESFLNVKRGELPKYIKISEVKLPTSEMIQVLSVMYAGATMTNINCLEIPKGQELPATGKPNPEPDRDGEKKPEKKGGGAKRRSIFSGFVDKLSGMFTPNDDDDDTELN